MNQTTHNSIHPIQNFDFIYFFADNLRFEPLRSGGGGARATTLEGSSIGVAMAVSVP